MPSPKDDLECFITTYCRPEIAQRTISQFRESGGHDIKLTVFDNSPEPSKFSGVDSYYHFPFNPSLTRGWNWAIAMCKTPWVLVANDDLRIKSGWREVFESDHMQKAKIHHKFDAFFLHRSLVREIGWFDERFTTWYWEDVDYARRISEKGIPWCKVECPIRFSIESDKPPPDHEFYKKTASYPDNADQYEEKWGDRSLNWAEGGKPLIKEINYYPCVQLPT